MDLKGIMLNRMSGRERQILISHIWNTENITGEYSRKEAGSQI